MNYLSFLFCAGKTDCATRPSSLHCQCFALVAELPNPFWKDDEIVVDHPSIPHHTGAHPYLMKECRRRVLFAHCTLEEGEGDTEAKEHAEAQAHKVCQEAP